jgi:hypothetical protein
MRQGAMTRRILFWGWLAIVLGLFGVGRYYVHLSNLAFDDDPALYLSLDGTADKFFALWVLAILVGVAALLVCLAVLAVRRFTKE